MSVLIHHLALALAALALLDTGLRVAAAVTAGALERAVAGLAIAAALAVAEALGLGLAGLGTDAVALTVAAALTWIAARWAITAPAVALRTSVATWWSSLGWPQRAGLGAVAGAGLAWAVFLVRFPGFGWDGIVYHLPEVVAWVQQGRPGSIEAVLPGWPVGNYPLANEVLLAWSTGIARSFAPVAVWSSIMISLLAGAAWLGLRTLRVPRGVALLAIGVVCTLPVLGSTQLNGPATDLPSLAWLVSAAALAVAAVRRREPGLLGPALLAAGLAVGTKTTALPLSALVLGLALFALRDRLRTAFVPLALGAGGALVVGGTWYVRNAILHGSPFWPFFELPWADRAPAAVTRIDNSFLQRPLRTLELFGGDQYLGTLFAGGTLLLAAALLAPLLARRRTVLAAAVVTAASLLLWAAAPVTGVTDLRGANGATVSTLRYLLPTLAAALVTLSLAARVSRRTQTAVTAVLGAALGLNLWQLFDLGYPAVPSPRLPLLGALAGAVVAGAFAPLVPWRRLLRPATAVAAALAVGAGLAVAAPNMVSRHERMPVFDGGLLHVFDGPASDGRTIAMAPSVTAMLAGRRLKRRVEALPRDATCAQVLGHVRRGWVVVGDETANELFGPITTPACVAGLTPAYRLPGYRIYGPGSIPRNLRGLA
jgi:hypothetical protein